MRDVDWELVACEHLAAAWNRASLLEGWRVDELLETAHVQPAPAESTLRHHRLISNPLPQVRHQLVVAARTDCRWDEPHEVVSQVLDRVEDLRLGLGRHDLPVCIETGRHFRLLVIVPLLLLLVPFLVLQIQFELAATLAVHRPILQRRLPI